MVEEKQDRKNRGPYNRVSKKDMNRIISAFENGQDYIQFTETLDVTYMHALN